jgi:hypothetical protein
VRPAACGKCVYQVIIDMPTIRRRRQCNFEAREVAVDGEGVLMSNAQHFGNS